MGIEVIRHAEAGAEAPAPHVEAIALGLMGAGPFPAARLSESAVWDRADGALAGRGAILAALAGLAPPEKIRIEQVVSHGRAATVSGRITRAGATRLYCHVLRFATSAQDQLAHIVSFEHPGGRRDA